ncbi:cytochrome P450 77A1 [Physcomitrium patens]|uniref:Cytochrome P450 n=1 Tax=Physcomitrium patens TaxID=3218 RepID=A0A2K1J1V7_PHYPA|nr:cytochrome P450 77A1-like [Physcomitrium patens]PNR35508.1 hypothetical protein PHYPA_023408 [Physcomitrium patens]|eukprot:XP_024403148.1 cytochrome P450 77A1-like [Physcomitrella patens]
MANYIIASNALVLLAFVTFFFVYFLRAFILRDKKLRPKYPPSPWKWPILGNLPQLLRGGPACHTTFRLLAKELGPVYNVWLGGSFPMVIVTGEETVHEALIKQSSVFSSRPKLLSWQHISAGFKTTMTSPFGPHWQKLRKTISVDLLGPSKLASYKPIRDSEIQKLLARLREQAHANAGLVSPLDQLRTSAVDVIMRIGFGEEFALMEAVNSNRRHAKIVELDRCFRQLMDAGSIFQLVIDSSVVARTLLFPLARSANRNIETVADNTVSLVMPIVQQRKRYLQDHPATETRTFVDALISCKGESALTDLEIVWNVVELMVGGTDNTSHILEWALANMVKYPHIQEKVYTEVRCAMGPNLERRLVEESELDKLPYLQAVVKESMRRHMMTPLAIPKLAAQDCKLSGYDIPKGTMVVFHAGALAMDDDIWTDPLNFRPERFLAGTGSSNAPVTQTHKHAFMPFGAGRRSCPGAAMGFLHLHHLFANLIYAFEWGPESPRKAVDFTEKFRMVVTMKNPLRATIKERTHFRMM